MCVVHMKPKLKNGKKYMILDHSSFKFTISKLHQRLDNLFNGDKTLGEYDGYKVLWFFEFILSGIYHLHVYYNIFCTIMNNAIVLK